MIDRFRTILRPGADQIGPDTSENAEFRGPRPGLVGDPFAERLRKSTERAFTGLEVDVRGFLGQLPEAMQNQTEAINRIHRWLQANPNQTPVPRIWKATRIAPSGGAATYTVVPFQQPMDTGGPNAGYRWEIGAHFIYGTDPFTVTASTVAALYLGAQPPQDGAIAPVTDAVLDSSIRYSVTTLPWGGMFASHAVAITPGDSVYYVVKSAGNGQALTGQLLVWEYRERENARTIAGG